MKIQDSGKRIAWKTGMVREPKVGLGRYDLIPGEGLERLAQAFEAGARKYGDRNWEKGQPWGVCVSACVRHIYKWVRGWKDEDHLALACCNLFFLMWYEKNYPEGNDISSSRKK